MENTGDFLRSFLVFLYSFMMKKMTVKIMYKNINGQLNIICMRLKKIYFALAYSRMLRR